MAVAILIKQELDVVALRYTPIGLKGVRLCHNKIRATQVTRNKLNEKLRLRAIRLCCLSFNGQTYKHKKQRPRNGGSEEKSIVTHTSRYCAGPCARHHGLRSCHREHPARNRNTGCAICGGAYRSASAQAFPPDYCGL